MKTFALLPLALLFVSSAAFADDQLRNVQTELKNQGFYYGDVTGQSNAETSAAIRRYQIRNGLEVTGTLNPETVSAMGIGGPKKAPAPTVKRAPAPAPAPASPPAPAPAPVEKKSPPANLRRDSSVEESDRNFLRREEARDTTQDAVAPLAPPAPRSDSREDTSVVDPPAPLEPPSADFPVLFAGTPFANAPLSVQQQTLRKAQTVLANRGHYLEVIDGLPGPATEEALLSFQRAQRLTLTGRLDMATLSQLRLMAGSATYSGSATYGAPRRPYRGIWINKGGLRFGFEFD